MNINWQTRELNLKIVYYGPALSGKTTNLEQIHARLSPERRSELTSLKTQGDRTLFFDFMQVELGKISGLTPKLHLYTVPGQTYYEASRRVVLRGVDGVVFVADSHPRNLHANQQAWRDLNSHLAAFDLSLESVPAVIQCNKQDLPNALSVDLLQRLFARDGLPAGQTIPLLPAAALRGEGVFETFKLISRNVLTHIQKLSV